MAQDVTPVAKAQRLAIGLLILLLVDFIWVASSELTEYIFKTQNYNKPFFSTYLKTSLFMLYLPGFIIYRPWREQCQLSSVLQLKSLRSKQREAGHGYKSVQQGTDSETEGEMERPTETEEGDGSEKELPRSLSTPTFQPLRGGRRDAASPVSTDRQTETGTDSEPDTNSRKVRFSKVAEVRSMSASEALHANLARLSYSAHLRAAAALERAANRLSVRDTGVLAASFSLLFFLGNYSYQAALSYTEAGIVNVLSASSCLFTLLLSALFPSTPADRLSLTKFSAVLFTMMGVTLVSFSDLKLESGVPLGALWALAGSLLYSSYIVFLRRKIDHEDKLDVPMFFSFVGLFSFLSLWPVFFILHFSGSETFQLPNQHQLAAMILNGIVGTVLSELLWLMGCFYTSSLLATLSISLTIPLTTFADVLVKKVEYDRLFYAGSLPMFLSFFLVALLSHWDNWDPLLEGVNCLVSKFRACCCARYTPSRVRRQMIAESLEQECLIEAEQEEEEGSNA